MSAPSPETLIRPRSGKNDLILLADGRTIGLQTCVRSFTCLVATAEERRYGCWLVVGADGEEYIVSAEVSGRYSRTFRPCSGSR
jgi:hypothetical protein